MMNRLETKGLPCPVLLGRGCLFECVSVVVFSVLLFVAVVGSACGYGHYHRVSPNAGIFRNVIRLVFCVINMCSAPKVWKRGGKGRIQVEKAWKKAETCVCTQSGHMCLYAKYEYALI